jgi:hypothetical protein
LQFGYFVGYFPPSSVVLLLWLSYQQIVVAEKLLHCFDMLMEFVVFVNFMVKFPFISRHHNWYTCWKIGNVDVNFRFWFCISRCRSRVNGRISLCSAVLGAVSNSVLQSWLYLTRPRSVSSGQMLVIAPSMCLETFVTRQGIPLCCRVVWFTECFSFRPSVVKLLLFFTYCHG